MFCVKCGKEGQTYKSLCDVCFLESNKFTSVPDHIDLPQCVHCDEYQMERGWAFFERMDDAVHQAVVESVSVSKEVTLSELLVDIRQLEPTTFPVHVLARLRYEDLQVEEHLETIVRVKRSVCAKCNKIQGNYFESIIQVRTAAKKLTEEEKEEVLGRVADQVESLAQGSREAFISKVVEEHGGFDLYVSTNALGKTLARELVALYGAEYKESASLQGQKDGRDIYRVTYLVRLPPYRVRDVVLLDSKPYLVLSMGPMAAKLRDLRTSETLTMNNSDLRTVPVIGTKKDFLDAVVLTETEREMQIMHPTSYKTVEVKKPKGYKRKGDTAKIFSYEGEVFVIGN